LSFVLLLFPLPFLLMPTASFTPDAYRPGPHRVALLGATLTWPLLLVGGSVSVYRVGMAVPDWPTTFGVNMFLYNFLESPWGVFIEHSHRLYGALVGLACIGLAVWFAVAERRGWMKALGAFALMAVIAQGILGGARVRLNSTNLAFLHGCTAQAFFALMVALCVLTGRDSVASFAKLPDTAHLRRRALVTLGLVYVQIVLGAQLRHFGSGLVLHAIIATAVWGHAVLLAWRVERQRSVLSELLPSAWLMALAASLQIVLGVVAWLMLSPFDGTARSVLPAQALVRIGHQGVGALLLASVVVLTLRAFYRLRPPAAPVAAPRLAYPLEAVA
jgi:cytochrome c oxidase assembly protein subunit 15